MSYDMNKYSANEKSNKQPKSFTDRSFSKSNTNNTKFHKNSPTGHMSWKDKDEDSVIVHHKSSKPKKSYDEIEIPDFILQKEHNRRRRENNQKYKNKKYR